MSKRFSYVSFSVALLLFLNIFQHGTAKDLGEDCTGAEDCEDDLTVCGPGNTCICNEYSVPNRDNTTCLGIVNNVGDPCEINTQCSQGSLGNLSYCDLLGGKNCRCNLIASVPNRDGNKCLPLRTTIGAPCEESVQCQNGVPGPNSICKIIDEDSHQDTCQCDDYSVTAPGQQLCLQIRDKIGDRCSANIQCTVKLGDLSECRSRECRCKEDEAIGNEAETKCLQAEVPIRQPCEQTNQCVGYPNSVCSTSKRCDCVEDFVPSSPLDNCLPVVNELGKYCDESQQCSSGDPGYLSACMGNECRCTANATSGHNQHVCKPNAIYVGDTCEITAQCTVNLGHSFCQRNSCVCLSEALISRDRTMCLLKAYLGEECREDIQCNHVGHSICSAGNVRTCECDVGYIPNPSSERECIRLADFIGESCEEDESQCRELDGAECRGEDKKCLCDEDKEVASQNKKRCLGIKENLGDECEESVECQVGNSWCKKGQDETKYTCGCKPNFVEDGNRCLKMAEKYGDICQENSQCDHLGLKDELPCHDGLCQCIPPKGFHNKLCIEKTSLNGPCTNINECHFGINNLTLCVGKPGGDLGEKWCQCMPNALPGEDGKCYIAITVGDGCQNDVECSTGIIGPVFCNKETRSCTCRDGYKGDTGGIRCSGGYSIINNFNMGSLVIGFIAILMLS